MHQVALLDNAVFAGQHAADPTQARRMSAPNASARPSSPGWLASYRISGWRLPSPAWNTFTTRRPYLAERSRDPRQRLGQRPARNGAVHAGDSRAKSGPPPETPPCGRPQNKLRSTSDVENLQRGRTAALRDGLDTADQFRLRHRTVVFFLWPGADVLLGRACGRRRRRRAAAALAGARSRSPRCSAYTARR